ncbi:MAG: arylamine N-acetyltransferase [Limisphaerales bacterium]
MNAASSPPPVLTPNVREKVLTRLGLSREPKLTLSGLQEFYAAWCAHVPFDNVRKLIHVRSHNPGPLPSYTPQDFFDGFLKYGTGGTCWAGAGAMHALLNSLGFDTERGIATMLHAPHATPNHGTVLVRFGHSKYLVDSSMIFAEPLLLDDNHTTGVNHPAWGVRCCRRDGRWHIAWRPLHKTDGFECRIERFGATWAEFQMMHEATRAWSPFNFEVSARKNRNGEVVGVGFGHAVKLRIDGGVDRAPASYKERVRILIEDVGLTEEIVSQLPDDLPTPRPHS